LPPWHLQVGKKILSNEINSFFWCGFKEFLSPPTQQVNVFYSFLGLYFTSLLLHIFIYTHKTYTLVFIESFKSNLINKVFLSREKLAFFKKKFRQKTSEKKLRLSMIKTWGLFTLTDLRISNGFILNGFTMNGEIFIDNNFLPLDGGGLRRGWKCVCIFDRRFDHPPLYPLPLVVSLSNYRGRGEEFSIVYALLNNKVFEKREPKKLL